MRTLISYLLTHNVSMFITLNIIFPCFFLLLPCFLLLRACYHNDSSATTCYQFLVPLLHPCYLCYHLLPTVTMTILIERKIEYCMYRFQ